MKPRVREVIVVEGRYDKNALSQVVDAVIVTLDGFAVFHDREKLAFLRRLAARRGLIVLTDSDGAGFVLRRYLKGALPEKQIRHAYIPDVAGKERRKRKAGKEGKLGVEGMRPEILLESLRRAGATFLDNTAEDAAGETGEKTAAHTPENRKPAARTPLTKADLFAWGLTGGSDSAQRRKALLRRLSLPEKLGTNAMLEALNLLFDRDALLVFLRGGEQEEDRKE